MNEYLPEKSPDQNQSMNIFPTAQNVLAALGISAARVLRSNIFENKLEDILSAIGGSCSASHCLLFNLESPSGSPEIRILAKWDRPSTEEWDMVGILAQILPRTNQSIDGLFIDSLSIGATHPGFASYSLAVIPTHQAEILSGYLTLFCDPAEQAWPADLRDALRTTAVLTGAIQDRYQLEEKFRENEIRNRVIINSLPDLVIRVDALGKILDYTARKDHPLFINRDEVTGKLLSEIWPKVIVKKIIHGKKKSRGLAQQFVDEFKLPFSNKVYESRLEPISSQEALIMIRDVTEQAELRQMKSDFINQASHELRTPVTAAILMTELIQGGGTPQEIEEYWQILNSELNRQKILIDRLLIAGRLESGMMHLEMSPIELEPILRESINAVKPIARKKHIQISLSIPAYLPRILGDKSGLEQVFINLINNATKFSPEGSSVNVVAVLQGNTIEVSVIDQGMGIPPNQTSHLFERFFRARDVTIAEIPGSGVGLYIVKSIMEGLGGSIRLFSSSSTGTTFTATLRCSS
jgi:signal transduction histidine kinase